MAEELDTPVADICHLQCGRTGQRLLHVEVPAGHVGRGEVVRDAKYIARAADVAGRALSAGKKRGFCAPRRSQRGRVIQFPLSQVDVAGARGYAGQIPLGFSFKPPRSMNSRIVGCSKMMAPPARNTVLPVPNTSQATPIRGERLFLSVA